MSAQEQGVESGRWSTIPRTLIFIRQGDSVLLMRRSATTPIFPNRYNGIGGHVERNEDVYSSALREIEEETGLTASQLRAVQLRGVLQVDAGKVVGILLFIFSAEALSREVRDSTEGMLAWVALADVAKLPVVDDLPLILPRIFGAQDAQTMFYGHSSYDAHDQLVLRFA